MTVSPTMAPDHCSTRLCWSSELQSLQAFHSTQDTGTLPKEMVIGYCMDPENPLELADLWPNHSDYPALVFEEPSRDFILESVNGFLLPQLTYSTPFRPTVNVFLVRHSSSDDVLCVRISDVNGLYLSDYRRKWVSLKKLWKEATVRSVLYYEHDM